MFEKEAEELEKEKCELLGIIQGKDKVIQELKKENAELDCQMNRNKFCYSCTNATDRCFRNEIGCPCENYKSYKDEDEDAELKDKLEKLKAMGARRPCKEAYKTGFQDGYNKANEWHYPSKGEYPKECEDVLCYCKCRTEIKFYCVGHIVAGGDNKIRWWSSDRSEKLNVYAWKEIVPPKEIEENEN